MGAREAAGTPYETVIGLEVHAQLATRTKIFCGCSTRFGAAPNTQICPVCSGQPGVLPVLNRQVIDLALRMALATGCRIRRRSRFARKNYFYADLPKGYQISQYDEPLAEGGAVEIWLDGADEDGGPTRRSVRLNRIHIEEDAGKSIHLPAGGPSRAGAPGSKGGATHVDLNRAGVPLIEIVSEPDLRSPAEAAEYMRTLRAIVRALQICDGNLEQGSLRCDANVSLRPVGSQSLGTRTEVKNLNSFRFLERALRYEVERQRALLSRGEAVVQETRLWDTDGGVTRSLRSKEEAHDYRYFPDPDLPPLLVDEAWIERLRGAIPELPGARRARLMGPPCSLSPQAAAALTREQELGDYFEQTVAAGAEPQKAANWILTELLGAVDDPRDVARAPVTPEGLAGLLELWRAGKISGKLAKAIWPKMWDSGKPAAQIAEEEDLYQQSDSGALEAAVQRALDDNPAQVEQYRAGKTKVLGFFVGQVMKATGGKANPQLVNQLLRDKLKG